MRGVANKSNPRKIAVIDFFSIGHHVWLLGHVRNLLGKKCFTIGSQLDDQATYRINWQQTKRGKVSLWGLAKFCRQYVGLPRQQLNTHVILCWDNVWMMAPVLLFAIWINPPRKVFVLQFRSRYLWRREGWIDWAKFAVYLAMQLGLMGRFRLMSSWPGCHRSRNVLYFPDCLTHGNPMAKRVARERLGWQNDWKILLYWGSTKDKRKGYDLVKTLIESNSKAGCKVAACVSEFDNGNSQGNLLTITANPSNYVKGLVFSASDVVAAPYQKDFIGTSGVINDAILYNRPFVATEFLYAKVMASQFRCGVVVPERRWSSLWEVIDLANNVDEKDIQMASMFLINSQKSAIEEITKS